MDTFENAIIQKYWGGDYAKYKAEKGKKMQHYFERPLNKFVQYDVFVAAAEDDLVKPDKDGDAEFCSVTNELMHSGTVRVLIVPGTPVEDVRRALKKVSKWIKEDGLYDPDKPAAGKRENPDREGLRRGLMNNLDGARQELHDLLEKVDGALKSGNITDLKDALSAYHDHFKIEETAEEPF